MTPELMFWLVGLLIVILSGGAALAWLIVAGLAGVRADLGERMDALDARMAALETRMTAIETHMAALGAALSSMETRLSALTGRTAAD